MAIRSATTTALLVVKVFLNIDSLDSLKQKLTKVIIVALIFIGFKLMVSFEVNSISELQQHCDGVLMLACSWLIGRTGNH